VRPAGIRLGHPSLGYVDLQLPVRGSFTLIQVHRKLLSTQTFPPDQGGRKSRFRNVQYLASVMQADKGGTVDSHCVLLAIGEGRDTESLLAVVV
jgi:hypothetical protein